MPCHILQTTCEVSGVRRELEKNQTHPTSSFDKIGARNGVDLGKRNVAHLSEKKNDPCRWECSAHSSQFFSPSSVEHERREENVDLGVWMHRWHDEDWDTRFMASHCSVADLSLQ